MKIIILLLSINVICYNTYSQNILSEVDYVNHTGNYYCYKVSINNNSDSILVLSVHPSYSLNIMKYEELVLDDSIEYNRTDYTRKINHIIFPHQATIFKIKISKDVGAIDFSLPYDFIMKIEVNLLKTTITKQKVLFPCIPLAYSCAYNFKKCIKIQLPPPHSSGFAIRSPNPLAWSVS